MENPYNVIQDQEILDRLRKSDLINKCINFAKEYGETTSKVFSFHTRINASYQIGNLEINSEEGSNSQGNGFMTVTSKGETVLSASINYGVKEENWVNGYGINVYNPGKWEDYISRVMGK